MEEEFPDWVILGTVFLDANDFLCVVMGEGTFPRRQSLVSTLKNNKRLELSFLKEEHDCMWIARKNNDEKWEIISLEELGCSFDECELIFKHETEADP